MQRVETRAGDTTAGPRGWRRGLIVLLVFALLAVLALRIALPTLLRITAQSFLSDEVREVSARGIDLDLRRGWIAIEGLTLRGGIPRRQLASVGRLSVDFQWAGLLDGSVVVESVSLEAPEIYVAYDADGRLNWAVLGGDGGQEPGAESEPGAVFEARVAEVDIGAGTLRLIDESEDGLPDLSVSMGAIRLEGLTLGRQEAGAELGWGLEGIDASDWTFGVVQDGARIDFDLRASAGPVEKGGRIPFDFAASREGAASIAVEGEVQPTPFEATAHLEWRDLNSHGIPSLLAVQGVVVEKGTSEGALDLRFSLAPGPDRGLRANGQLAHHGLALALELELEDETAITVGIEEFRVELAELKLPIAAEDAPAPVLIRIHVARVEVVDPVVDLVRVAPGGTDAPMPPAGVLVDEADAPRTPPIALQVDSLSIRNGRVSWRDPALGPDHEKSVASIELTAQALSWPDVAFEQGSLVLGSLGIEPLRIEGRLAPGRADLDLSASRIAVAPWNDLITHYSDYSVTRGEVSLTGPMRLRGEEYDASIQLRIRELQVTSESDAFQRTFGMSLSKAIPLLTDQAGVIRLELPVRGRLSEAMAIDLVPVIRDALQDAVRNTIVSSLATGANTAGAVLRRTAELASMGIGEAEFRPGSSDLARGANAVLQLAVKLAGERRRSRLELVARIVSDDLRALGIRNDRAGRFLGSIGETGRALIGASKEVEAEVREQLGNLAASRMDTVEAWLIERGNLSRERIVREPWDGRIREGGPGVMLRLRSAKE